MSYKRIMIETLLLDSLDHPLSVEEQKKAITSLEEGNVLFFPSLQFPLLAHEEIFYDPLKVDPKRKNISYDCKTDHLGGTLWEGEQAAHLKVLMKRYNAFSRNVIATVLPHYLSTLTFGKTSFRPVEIAGRKSSALKDDTRIHVDAFPSNPTKGKRILRVFANVNPDGKPRVWRVGEPFSDILKTFAPQVKKPFPGSSALLKWLGITKDYRTLYDHYMLRIHDKMKQDGNYQREAQQREFHFPAHSVWMVYTDKTAHAALAGQHVFEQTCYLPIEGLFNPQTAPKCMLEAFLAQKQKALSCS